MTEEEWLRSDDPMLLMTSLRGLISSRKAHLFDLECARVLSHLWSIPAFEAQMAMNELRIEGMNGDVDQYERIQDETGLAYNEARRLALENFTTRGVLDAHHEHLARPQLAMELALAVCNSLPWWEWMEPPENPIPSGAPLEFDEQNMNLMLAHYRAHLPHLRCIVGNPFRPVSFSSEWRTSTAVAIAQSMYESRDFGPMPLLADALQDAGCETPEIIDHCRGPGPHVRGCWVVDGVLGKT